ncbi:1-(5-phosphoribosyl)-5-[(5-phosphoribosylamino)methylideneamino]imidazole-4-carboxamide isomerase [Hugenholtzia roseola]|uniref:1-(5-phosphoribosyl)-5-[(5- phosphoribosylamino)methylideneamino]imidazole-4- carboxamide isomerase n=1 Tax=Hugenholtzia roseola TaxID=1002 RepID=UPI00040FDD35|nr:1-(5-phosphoribosyl)-5-[(5-phosphoribosylamino)methylideneamino]imidazole-4-carboxamide isomerase [Hugenholtzia roseola]
MQLIPAIDLIEGKCVRLTKGDYNTSKIYNADPLVQAQIFEEKGITRLHMVDLDGAKAREPKHLSILEKIATKTNLIIDYGGGITTLQAAQEVLNRGAEMVNIGSLAVKQPDHFWEMLALLGGEKVLLAADVKQEHLLTSGWLEGSTWHIFDFIETHQKKGLTQFFCTDIDKDGALEGINLELYQKLRARFPELTLIASGGVSSQQDLDDLATAGIDGVIVGKAIYENKILI